MASDDFRRQLEGYGLTTAQILYGLPDHPKILQSYLWQEYDLAPAFPELHRFLEFWRCRLDGALHSVQIAHKRLIEPGLWRSVDKVIVLH